MEGCFSEAPKPSRQVLGAISILFLSYLSLLSAVSVFFPVVPPPRPFCFVFCQFQCFWLMMTILRALPKLSEAPFANAETGSQMGLGAPAAPGRVHISSFQPGWLVRIRWDPGSRVRPHPPGRCCLPRLAQSLDAAGFWQLLLANE